MKRFLFSGLWTLLFFPPMGRATDAVYINNGTITFPISIDATNVVNNGSFDFSLNPTVKPYDTSNTRNFTNSGTMVGSVGFQFDNAPSTGVRKLSASFRNRLTGRITAQDSPGFLLQVGGVPVNTTLVLPSYLYVSATNIINEGTLTAGAAGILRLVGNNIDLSRSGLQIEPIVPQGSINGVGTNYFRPEVAIYDYYWGQTNQVMNSANIIQSGGAIVTSPPSRVDVSGGRVGFATLQLVNPVGDFYTNTVGVTNITFTNATGTVTSTNLPLTNIVQAVFVGLPTTGSVDWGVKFFNSQDPQNPFKTVSVRVALTSTNVVSNNPDLASIFLVDTLASATNRGFYSNFASIYNLRPQNYLLERVQPFEYHYGFGGNALFAPDLLYKTNFASPIVTNEYAAYSAFVDNIASRPPNIPAGTVTNLPGRIEVLADVLDMSRTRFRADGLLNIQTKHLVSSSNAVVDCENLSYTLGSTTGNLKIQNLAQESVSRFTGYTYVWSGLWTNYLNTVLDNYTPDPADTNVPPIKFIPAPITNVTEVRLYTMLFDAQAMVTEVPVIVNALVTHSTNVVVNDKMTVVQSFLIDGLSFTLNGGIIFSNTFFTDTTGNTVVISLDSWVGTNAPSLKYFTNNGTLNIPSEAHFGDDRPLPYSTFVNTGLIDAFGQTINSDYCELKGNNVTAAAFTLITRSGKVEGGSVNAGGDAQFYADVLKFSQATIQTVGRLDLTVANALFDSGGGAGNSFICNDGFRLLVKPPTGDLLGTAVQTVAPPFAEVDQIWAGADRGPSPAGFLNNTALGTLILTPGDFEAQYPPLFLFAGAGVNNGLYVDVLDLSKLADYQNELQIDPNLTLYYAAAKLGFTPPPTNGVPQLPEEYLNGQFGGHLQWVREFAGPGSSVAVVSNGVSVMVNRALRNSLIIDSDGDGIPNGLDFFPFNNALVAQLGILNHPPLTAVLSWNGTAQSVYQVQSATNFVSPDWHTVLYYTNTAATNGGVAVQVPVPPGSIQQFYRVGKVSP